MELIAKPALAMLLASISISLLVLSSAEAAPAAPDVYKTFIQADGTELVLHLWGDEYANGWETKDGYTAMLNAVTGMWEYAVRDSHGRLVASGMAINTVLSPVNCSIAPHIRPITVNQD